MIKLGRIELDYLLRQVTINYLDANGNPTSFNYSALANALDTSGIREVNGANNNIVGHGDLPNTPNPNGTPGDYTLWGTADSPFLNISIGQPVSSAPDPAYNVPGGPVTDSDPRLISNLISTMYSTGANANPAAGEAAAASGGGVIDPSDPNGTVFMPDPGVLGGARFNQWFTAFGQFFDHGLDFIVRDPSATAKIKIDLSPLDPLYDADGANNIAGDFDDVTSITVTRGGVANVADAGADNTFGTTDDVIDRGADGIAGTADDTLSGTSGVFAKAVYTNNTGLLIDQSQTYGSVASVNAFIREYDANGRPTGRVVTGDTAALTDTDATNDADARGLQTWADIKLNALRIGVELGDMDVLDAPMLRVDPAGKLLFTPDPNAHYTTASLPTDAGYDSATDPFVRDASGNVLRTGHAFLLDMGLGANPARPGFDPAVLDAYYVSGDGRANENIGLTAVHEVFHEEHNINVENIKSSVLAEAAAIGGAEGEAYLHDWQTEVTPGVWEWDGEKLFQAARLITEQEYNHIAVAEYVRSLSPFLPEFVSYSSDINMGVSLEFSQAVFRLGHSMLTETFNVTDPNTGQPLKLLDAFLNPTLYDQIGAADLALGFANTYANMPDEFVTPALQQTLLGQPLDLAAINIARGRDVGLPTLNELRQQIYDQVIQNTNNAGESAIAPYTSWTDFGAHLGHPESLVNFIAAYGRDTDGTWGLQAARDAYMAGTGTLQDIRDAAQRILDASAADFATRTDPNDGLGYSLAEHDAATQFMGGNPVYNETTGQWEFAQGDQGFWDVDLWIGGLAERPLFDGPLGTTFSFVMLDFAQRMQDGDRFYYLYRMPFAHPVGVQVIAEQFTDMVSRTLGIEHFGSAFGTADARFELTDGNDFHDNSQHIITFVDGTTGPASDGHTVIAGNGGNDLIIAGLGDDVVYGDEGNDYIQGSQGNDYLLGGDGDDYITDDENDDHIRGGAGNDKLFAGPGVLDLVLGEEGDDEVHGGTGIDEVYGGDGDDLVYGDGDTDKVFGEDGNDYVEGGDGPDEMFGGSGNDWLRGGVGDDSLQGESGNDLLEGGLGPTANNGDVLIGDQPVGPIGTESFLNEGIGFDVASYEDANVAAIASLNNDNIVRQGALLDTYSLIEGLVGTRFNDELVGASEGNAAANDPDNLLVGGSGNDILKGLGGDDQIFGDQVVVNNDLQVDERSYTAITNWKGTGEVRPDFDGAGTEALGHILGDNGAAGTSDVVVFSGNRSDYTISEVDANTVIVVDNRGIDSTPLGDYVSGVELFRFNGTDVALADLAPDNLAPTLSAGPASFTGTEDIALADTLATFWTDPDSANPLTFSLSSRPGANPLHGTVTVNADGTFTYTPTTNYFGPDRFAYTVSDGTATLTRTAVIYVDPVNDAPTAPSPVAVTTDEDTAVSALIGASDIEGDTLTYAVGSTVPTLGTVSFTDLAGAASDGFTYTPNANANGSDTFTILISDGNGGTFEQTVNVTINPVNDAPTAPATASHTIAEDTSVTAAIGASDVDNDTLTYSLLAGAEPAFGTVTFDDQAGNASDTYAYTPDADANGTDTFTIEISDGNGGVTQQVVTIDVTPVNDSPTGTVTIANNAASNDGPTLVASNTLADVDGMGIVNYQWQVWNATTSTWDDIALATAATFTPTGLYLRQPVRVEASYTDGDGTVESVVSDVAAVMGTNSSDVNGNSLVGTGGSDLVFGRKGNDRLVDTSGTDTAYGGAGNDTFIASADLASDTYDGGAGGADVLDLRGTLAGANVNLDTSAHTVNGVDLAASSATSAAIGTDTVLGIERVIGNAGNNILVAGAGNNRLEGGSGNDILVGGAGADTLVGGGGNDTASYETASSSVYADLLSPGDNLGDAEGDAYNSIRNLTGSAHDDTLGGHNLANVIDGGAGADSLLGRGGNDTLIGGVGNDTMNGGTGNDTFVFAAGFGNDTVNGFDHNATGGQDKLDISALGITDFTAEVTIATDATGTLVSFANSSDTIFLASVTTAGVIDQSDFII